MRVSEVEKKQSIAPSRIVSLRNRSVASIYRKLLMLGVLMTVVVVISACLVYITKSRNFTPQYIPVDAKNQVITELPLNKPHQSDEQTIEFATQAIRALNNFDYVNYKMQLNNAHVYFLNSAWDKYLGELSDTKTLKAVQSMKAIVSVELTQEVKLKKEMISLEGKDVYSWLIMVPAVMEYIPHAVSDTREIGKKITQSGTIYMRIVRVPLEESNFGEGIMNYTFKPDEIKP